MGMKQLTQDQEILLLLWSNSWHFHLAASSDPPQKVKHSTEMTTFRAQRSGNNALLPQTVKRIVPATCWEPAQLHPWHCSKHQYIFVLFIKVHKDLCVKTFTPAFKMWCVSRYVTWIHFNFNELDGNWMLVFLNQSEACLLIFPSVTRPHGQVRRKCCVLCFIVSWWQLPGFTEIFFRFKDSVRLSFDDTKHRSKTFSNSSQVHRFAARLGFFFFTPPYQISTFPHNTFTNCSQQGMRTKRRTTKAGRAQSHCLSGTKQKAACTVEKEGERRKHQNPAAKKQNCAACMCVCVHVNENAASLQPADHRLSGSRGGGAQPEPLPVWCAQTTVSWEQRMCWWCAEGSDADAAVNPPTPSICSCTKKV